MKKIFAIMLAAVFLFSGCGNGNRSLGISEEIITDTEILKMDITDFTNEKIAVEIKNESKYEAGYGESYSIEFKKDGEWHILSPEKEASFIEVAYILEKESSCTWGDNLSRIYGKLPEGEYRLIKQFTLIEPKTGSVEAVTLAAEFSI